MKLKRTFLLASFARSITVLKQTGYRSSQANEHRKLVHLRSAGTFLVGMTSRSNVAPSLLSPWLLGVSRALSLCCFTSSLVWYWTLGSHSALLVTMYFLTLLRPQTPVEESYSIHGARLFFPGKCRQSTVRPFFCVIPFIPWTTARRRTCQCLFWAVHSTCSSGHAQGRNR